MKADAIVLGAILFDVVTGFTIALFTRTCSSQKMRKGLLNKIGEIFALVLAESVTAFSPWFGVNLGYDLATPVRMYIVVMEIWSIIENILKMSPTLEGLIKKEDTKNDKK